MWQPNKAADSSPFFFFFNDTATTEIYTLSLHDALPICVNAAAWIRPVQGLAHRGTSPRSEEHTSELQSHLNLVCRLLLEKKKNIISLMKIRLTTHTNHLKRGYIKTR